MRLPKLNAGLISALTYPSQAPPRWSGITPPKWYSFAPPLTFSVLTRACLRGRHGDERSLAAAIDAYEARRNAAQATIDWRFSTQDARTKRVCDNRQKVRGLFLG